MKPETIPMAAAAGSMLAALLLWQAPTAGA